MSAEVAITNVHKSTCEGVSLTIEWDSVESRGNRIFVNWNHIHIWQDNIIILPNGAYGIYSFIHGTKFIFRFTKCPEENCIPKCAQINSNLIKSWICSEFKMIAFQWRTDCLAFYISSRKNVFTENGMYGNSRCSLLGSVAPGVMLHEFSHVFEMQKIDWNSNCTRG